MDIKEYLKKIYEIVAAFDDEEWFGTHKDEQANTIIIAAVLSEMRKDERMDLVLKTIGVSELKKSVLAEQAKPQEEMATPKQKEWLKNNNVPGYDKMTKAEAHNVISDLIAKERGY